VGGKKKQTIGYRYYFTFIAGIGRRVNALTHIRVGEKEAWSGSVSDMTEQVINKPDLFGGDEKEGGIKGVFRLLPGEEDQLLPDEGGETAYLNALKGAIGGIFANLSGALNGSLGNIKATLGGLSGEWRGWSAVIYDGQVSAMNPYLKEWKFRVWRTTADWYDDDCWYPEKATIELGESSTLEPIDLASEFPQLVRGTDPSYPEPPAYYPHTITLGPYATDAEIVAGNPDGSGNCRPDDFFYFNGVKYGTTGGTTHPAGTVFFTLTAGSSVLIEIQNTINPYAGVTGTFHVRFVAGSNTIHGMNPAHIIYQCKTDPRWGDAELPDEIDEASFTAAADTLYDEGFGLCLPWFRQNESDIDSIVQVVLDHVGGITYVDPTTGQRVLKLLRNDYDPNTIPHFDEDSGLVSIDDDDSGSSEGVNEVIVIGHDPVTDLDFQVRVPNAAGRMAQGGPVSRRVEAKGIPTRDLALRKGQMDAKVLGGGLKRFTLRLDHRAYSLRPGDVIRISSAKRSIANMVVRLGETGVAGPGSADITFRCIEDVFGMPATSFTKVEEDTWTLPTNDAEPATTYRAMEMGYRDLLLQYGAASVAELDTTNAVFGMLASAPQSNSYLYDLATRASGESDFSIRTNSDFTGTAVLAADAGPLDTTITVEQVAGFESVAEQFLLVDDELVNLLDYDSETGEAIVQRGVGDTIPAAHSAGARVWTVDDDFVSDERDYADGETVVSRVLPRTSGDVVTLSEGAASEESTTLIARQARPYPPGNVQVDAVSVYLLGEDVFAEPVLTFAHRDRVGQEDWAVAHGDASVGPEPGTTYTVRVLDLAETLLREETGITADTWTYDSAMQAADSAPAVVLMELESVRDALTSWQTYRFRVRIRDVTFDTTLTTFDSAAVTWDRG